MMTVLGILGFLLPLSSNVNGGGGWLYVWQLVKLEGNLVVQILQCTTQVILH